MASLNEKGTSVLSHREWKCSEIGPRASPSAPAPSLTRQAYFFPQLMAPKQTGRQAPCPKSSAVPARCRHVDMAPSIIGRQSCLLAVRDFQREAGAVSVSHLSFHPSSFSRKDESLFCPNQFFFLGTVTFLDHSPLFLPCFETTVLIPQIISFLDQKTI